MSARCLHGFYASDCNVCHAKSNEAWPDKIGEAIAQDLPTPDSAVVDKCPICGGDTEPLLEGVGVKCNACQKAWAEPLYTTEAVVQMIMEHSKLKIKLISTISGKLHLLPVDATEVLAILQGKKL